MRVYSGYIWEGIFRVYAASLLGGYIWEGIFGRVYSGYICEGILRVCRVYSVGYMRSVLGGYVYLGGYIRCIQGFAGYIGSVYLEGVYLVSGCPEYLASKHFVTTSQGKTCHQRVFYSSSSGKTARLSTDKMRYRLSSVGWGTNTSREKMSCTRTQRR